MIYELDDRKPVLEGENFVAPNTAVIGSVLMNKSANVWWGCTLRGDNELITIGEDVNVQDGSVIHTDLGIPVVLERNVSVGHMVMLHGCTIRENSLIGIGAIVLNRAVVGKNCLIGAGASRSTVTCPVDSVPRQFGLLPARFGYRLDHLKYVNWGRQARQRIRERRHA